MGLSEELVSGAAFCVTSASMTLLNKAALSAFHFTAPTTLLCFQCTVTLLLVFLAFALGFGKMPPITTRLLLLWLPVNILFVGMVWVSGSCCVTVPVCKMTTMLQAVRRVLQLKGCAQYACSCSK